MLEDIIYVIVYGFVFASLYGIMTVGFSFICGLGGFYDIALPAFLMVGGFLYVIMYDYIGGWALPIMVLATGSFAFSTILSSSNGLERMHLLSSLLQFL